MGPMWDPIFSKINAMQLPIKWIAKKTINFMSAVMIRPRLA